MPTECITQSLDFGTVEGRRLEAAFDGGLVTSDAGGLLLGATDRAIRMMDRFALCFHDERRPEYIEHEVATLVGQRVFGIALGYEDLNDHDELRHDPMMAILAGKLTARREDCAPVAGKSTLNRLELSKLAPTRYHKISHNPVAIKNSSGRPVCGGAGARTAADHSRPRCDRRSAARRAGGAVFPRLLRLLLLPAALRVLRPPSAGRQAAERGDGRGRRRHRGGGARGGAHPPPVATGAHSVACRLQASRART